eukprot:6211027-Pleurochrysis_carterae.AAC.2
MPAALDAQQKSGAKDASHKTTLGCVAAEEAGGGLPNTAEASGFQQKSLDRKDSCFPSEKDKYGN